MKPARAVPRYTRGSNVFTAHNSTGSNGLFTKFHKFSEETFMRVLHSKKRLAYLF